MSNHIVSSMFVLSGIKRLTVLKMLAATFPLCSQAINSTALNTPGEKCSEPEDSFILVHIVLLNNVVCN